MPRPRNRAPVLRVPRRTLRMQLALLYAGLFQQLGTERVRHADGHGLGLALVRAIAGAHRAALSAAARPGGGLDVEVSFPASAALPDEGAARP